MKEDVFMKKIIFCTTLLFLLLVCFGCMSVLATSQSDLNCRVTNYKLFVDGKEITTDMGLYEINGLYFAPVRAIGEGLNTVVEYDVATQSILYKKDGNELIVPMNSNQFIFNGQAVTVSLPAHVMDGRTIVPIEDVVKCFGYSCLFYSEREIVSVYSFDIAPDIFVEPEIISSPARYHRNSGDVFSMNIDLNDGRLLKIFIDERELSSEEYDFDGITLKIDNIILDSLNIAVHEVVLCFRNDFILKKNVLVIDKSNNGNYTVNLTDYKFYVDEKEIKMETGLYEIGGVIFAPLRAIAEGMDAIIYWDSTTETAVFKKDENQLLVPMNSNQFIFNGQAVTVSLPAHIMDGRTIVPIEDVVKCFGYSCVADKLVSSVNVETKQIFIYSIDDYRKLLSDEASNIKLEYKNRTYNSVIVYVGFYNVNNRLECLERYLCDVNIGNGEMIIDIPKRVTHNDINNVKIFIWDDSFRPLSYRITVDKDGYKFF